MRLKQIAVSIALAACLPAAQADIVGGTNFVDISGSEPAVNPGFESTLAFGWNEATGVSLGSLLASVDTITGALDGDTLINSHMIGFDPEERSAIEATVTFDSEILGVIWVTDSLSATDALLGLPTITYLDNPPFYLGFESPFDMFSVSGNTLTFRAGANKPGDFLRVITAAVPEPSTYAMMGLGLFGVMLAARRRRSA
ncbi:PEP-CTERM sorting domain-containing protein [Acidovorax sp.]|uniref:PEP-CTERM sorting domain-containing protein n=1 Tax=Acidovorax sp. TaxID=1872122 RepID=UPI000BD23E95|nr:PEP-CTERM sorting domain-containing protein [Acidovorax sp.]OYW66323.1 MAG: hypothetical protein B7Z32_00575 [Hydrogenophilales bacterium 12-64-13]OYZ05881.1 MAG: hypothetical protein B7Y26_06045 [Hydrogenophilales bacterium 16-64-46]OZA39817.1 MAG: hypothetical protein B7X87_02070 [Hydrogenophilales bacterium 17-64-34]HQT00236.1 PEP-CTERM sorting domain-containing protein [Thiobacillus sp.]